MNYERLKGANSLLLNESAALTFYLKQLLAYEFALFFNWCFKAIIFKAVTAASSPLCP